MKQVKANTIVRRKMEELYPGKEAETLASWLKITLVTAKKILNGRKEISEGNILKLAKKGFDKDGLRLLQTINPIKKLKKDITPHSQVKSVLRQLFLRSRERNQALKNAGRRCQCGCNRKADKDTVLEVHHKEGILNWDEIYNAIYENLLCSPEKLMVLTKECHEKMHEDTLELPKKGAKKK
jgi:plasmid maintenance system antidote protein VapI